MTNSSLPPADRQALLDVYAQALFDANQRTNLVSRRMTADAVRRLVHMFARTFEALGLTQPSGLLVDVGTGAGLPGIPLAIRYPELEILLNESRKLRTAELRKFLARLPLPNASVLPGRIELPETVAALPRAATYITAFGVGPAERVIDLVVPLLHPQGRALLSIPADPSPAAVRGWRLHAADSGCVLHVHHRVLNTTRSILELRRLPP